MIDPHAASSWIARRPPLVTVFFAVRLSRPLKAYLKEPPSSPGFVDYGSSTLTPSPSALYHCQLLTSRNETMTPQFSKLPLFAPPVEARDLTFGTEQASGNISASSMLKIESLLNHPTSVETRYDRIAGPSNSFSPRMQTPDSFGLFKRPKLVKDAPVFVKGETKGQVHYPPFESLEDAISLTPWQRDELIRQHHHFKIYPSGGQKDGLISDCPRHIPYSSDKKDFMGKSGFEGFDGKHGVPKGAKVA